MHVWTQLGSHCCCQSDSCCFTKNIWDCQRGWEGRSVQKSSPAQSHHYHWTCGGPKKGKVYAVGFFCLFFLDIVTLISSWQLWSFTFPLPMTWWGSHRVLGVFLVLISLCMYFLTHGTSGNCTRQETYCINLLHSVLYLILFIGDQDATNSLDTSTFPNWEQWKKNLMFPG